MWKLLWKSPYRSEIWQKHYPQIAAFCEDFTQADNPHFVPNPGCSEVCDNLIVDAGLFHSNIICKEAKQFGRIEDNYFYPIRTLEQLFVDPKKGDYSERR